MRVGAALGSAFTIVGALMAVIAIVAIAADGAEIEGPVGGFFAAMPLLAAIMLLGFLGIGTLVAAFLLVLRRR